jgi:hypothetical protein
MEHVRESLWSCHRSEKSHGWSQQTKALEEERPKTRAEVDSGAFCKEGDGSSRNSKMRWTLHGAYLLLQTRTKVFKDELDEVFRRSVPEIQTAITSAGTRAIGGWTPTFGALL